jgi:translation initiation factor IF-3
MANPFLSSGPRPYAGRRPSYNQQHAPKALRKNDRIRVPEVRVIGADGKQVGILQTRDAIKLAQTSGLDLVEVSPGTRPPVCRILDYGKYMYELGKKQKDHKSHASKLKEVKFRPRIEQHDYITKLRHAEEFLFDGNKVKMTLFFKGRELEHKDLGFETVKRALADLAHVGTPDQSARLMGRNITLTLSPLPPNKRKLKFNLREGDEEEEPVAPKPSSGANRSPAPAPAAPPPAASVTLPEAAPELPPPPAGS